MTRQYPASSDPVTALTRPDGTTEPHSYDHGRTIGMWENVQAWGAKGDGSTDDTTAIQAAVDSGASVVFFPPGTYHLASGSSISLSHNSQKIIGTGYQQSGGSIISCANAYAFVTPTTGAVTNVTLEGFGIALRAGSTSGGGIKVYSNNYHSGWAIRDIDIELPGDGLSTDAGMWLSGWIGSVVERFRVANGGGDGVLIDSNGFVSNQYAIRDGTIGTNCQSGTTYAGIHIKGGGSKGLIENNDMESNKGYGILVDAGSYAHTIISNWFEANWNTSVLIADTPSCTIQGNSFQAPDTNGHEVAGCRHVKFTETLSTRRNNHAVLYNFIAQAPSNGVCLDIGANVSYTTVIGNHGLGLRNGSTISDSGSYSFIINNDPTAGVDNIYFPLGQSGTGGNIVTGTRGTMLVVGDSQTGDNGDPTATGLFAVKDAAGDESFSITRKGYSVFRTPNGDPGTGQLPTSSFLLYWDDANSRVVARYRASGGSTDVAPLGHAVSAAYTQTYSTADRTHANATAGSLTVSDGAGTNDGTIGAITADASVIAAVQELAAMINKIVTDHLDTKQLVNAVIDDLQTAGILG